MPKSRPRHTHFRGIISKTKSQSKMTTIIVKTTTDSNNSNNDSERRTISNYDEHEEDKNQMIRMKKCSQLFEESYCLNRGKCFNFTIGSSTMPTCECADGFIGERCEEKYLDGSYIPKIRIANIYCGSFLALVSVIMILYTIQYFFEPRKISKC